MPNFYTARGIYLLYSQLLSDSKEWQVVGKRNTVFLFYYLFSPTRDR
jgi:hypothetical protein